MEGNEMGQQTAGNAGVVDDQQTLDPHAEFERSAGLNEDDIDHLPIVRPGSGLTEHEVYLDLNNPGHGPFVAMNGQTIGTGNRVVAQKDLDPTLWDLLVRHAGDISLETNPPAETQ